MKTTRVYLSREESLWECWWYCVVPGGKDFGVNYVNASARSRFWLCAAFWAWREARYIARNFT